MAANTYSWSIFSIYLAIMSQFAMDLVNIVYLVLTQYFLMCVDFEISNMAANMAADIYSETTIGQVDFLWSICHIV